MAQIKFGTDGVRGRFNKALMVQDVLRLGLAHGALICRDWTGEGRPKVVVGRDSRVSGDALLGAYGAGIMSAGADLVDIGVIPTPAVAFAVKELGCQGAAMMSASHNPVPDNGIKLFGSSGKKLNDAEAREIEALVAQSDTMELAQGVQVGRTQILHDFREKYREFLLGLMEGGLQGQKLVLDCAHGAAAGHAEELFRAAGAEVFMLSNVPDGEKINVACGSTDLSSLMEAVKKHGADLGFAFDGDADRCLSVSNEGKAVTGDQMMVIMAKHFKAKGTLAGNRVVLTVMSNLGAELALQKEEIAVSRTAVGDRYVYEEMAKTGATLGGEQSGHILLLDRHCSGDGMLAGLVFAGIVKSLGRPLSDLVAEIPEMPQKLVNVGGVDKSRVKQDSAVLQAIEKAEQALGEEGRILVRPSGTEPLVRLMAEGPDEKLLDSVLEELKQVVLERLSLSQPA